jgi:ribosome-binding protein aMBF1 (putative translation factor)
MPNVAAVLKAEIRRLAKREIKAEVGRTKQAVVQYRHDIALLKRELREQARRIAFLGAQGQEQAGQPPADGDEPSGIRYSARSVRAQRRRLGLSAEDYGKLVGVSALTVYSWESGKARPRKAQFAALVAVRGIGKREALGRLERHAEAARRPRRKPK